MDFSQRSKVRYQVDSIRVELYSLADETSCYWLSFLSSREKVKNTGVSLR